jgi:hypothetical protein
MKKVKRLNFEVTYKVGMCNVELPDEVYEELQECLENGDAVGADPMAYPELQSWIVDNVKERDCMSHETEIEDY